MKGGGLGGEKDKWKKGERGFRRREGKCKENVSIVQGTPIKYTTRNYHCKPYGSLY